MPHDPNSNLFINELTGLADGDVAALKKAQQSYGNSWKMRGGVGAFMMLARKWDRLEKLLSAGVEGVRSKYDIFEAIESDKRPEGVIDDIRDLRRYLMLVEAEAIAMGFCPGKLAKDQEDGTASKGGRPTAAEEPFEYSEREEALLTAFMEEMCRGGEASAVGEAKLSIGEKPGTPLNQIHPQKVREIYAYLEEAAVKLHPTARRHMREFFASHGDPAFVSAQPTAQQLHPA